ncbi:MAG: alpha/beta hydrolase [Anaerolineae bacterium]|nr:alpha/beta hydrolase [Candidatus Roseilinea sp.]MDW8449431.1 alpha/beta hydrolase [Anaerolineae bacterium]
MSKPILAALFLLAATLGLHAPVRASQPGASPAQQAGVSFALERCEDVVVVTEPQAPPEFDENTDCGWLTVPARHADPLGPKIELGVVVLRANAARPQPDPLFMAQGGPGGSTIESYLEEMKDSPIRTERDIVLFDQRGARHTRPALACDELDRLTIDTIEQHLTPDEESRLSLEAAEQCRQRLIREGADLSAFDSAENAADVAALARALGYDKINFYGVSYGTLLAQHVMRDHPNILRSVILDAVAPLEGSFIVESARAEDRALTELFNACAADARCAAAYPNLERDYFDAVARLNNRPARTFMFDLETGKGYHAVLDGDVLQSLVFQALYATELLPFLPYAMARAAQGDYAPVGNLGSLFVFDRSVNSGMYFSVMCAEDAGLLDQAVDDTGLRPEVAQRNARDQRDFAALCRLWGVDSLPDDANVPVRNDVPALLLSGRFDPITPPANGERVAATLARARHFVFPNVGHGAFRSEPCASRIVQVFIANPEAEPDASCLATLDAPAFVAPDEIVPVPSLIRLTALSERGRRELAALGLGLLALLSAWVTIPLAWLVRKLTGREARNLPWLAKLNPWFTLLCGAVLAYFVGMAGAKVADLIAREDYLFLFGLPAEARSLFLLPPIALALAGLMAIGVVAGWRGWGWLRRINRALLVVAAAVCLGALASLGMLL